MSDFEAFFRDVESEAFWRRFAPWLHLPSLSSPSPSARGSGHGVVLGADEAGSVEERWRAAGYFRLDALLDPARTNALAKAITTLHSSDIHPTFIYVYDETWHILDSLRPRLSPLVGGDFEVLADVWAWCIDPRTDRGGWPLHRGWYEDVRDATGMPGLVNVWVALTDATERNACMHIVPLTADPHYPDDLHNLTALSDAGLALPTPAGSALVWSANAAHWGGTCDPSFGEPRISLSFTARRRADRTTDLPSLRLPLAFRDRLDLIAEQFETYGHQELGPERNEMRWARMVSTMREASRRSRRSIE